jgi:hypothetical protein
MPIEASLLKDAPIEADKCPKCGHEPLELSWRGHFQRRRKKWPWSKPRPYCAVICANCKETIAWEDPLDKSPVIDELKKDIAKIKKEDIKRKVQSAAASSAASAYDSSSTSMATMTHERRWKSE